MALTDKKYFGRPIGKQLSVYLKRYLKSDDLGEISSYITPRVSTYTFTNMLNRKTAVNGANIHALVELAKRAIKNCTNQIERGEEARKYLLALKKEGSSGVDSFYVDL